MIQGKPFSKVSKRRRISWVIYKTIPPNKRMWMTSSLQSYSTRQFLRIHWILLFCWWQDLSFLLFSSRVYWFFITRFSSARDYISTNNFTISGRIISETDRVISIKFRLQSVNKGMFQMTLLWISLLCLSRKIISVPQIVYCQVSFDPLR